MPHRFVLSAGTTMTRIHSANFDAAEFNPTAAVGEFVGGRFDSTPGDHFAFLYTAGDNATAICEMLLRDLPIGNRGIRELPTTRLSRLRITRLRTTVDLELVTLRSGKDLAAIGQDTWLTTTTEYATTRKWASAIRGWAPWACGLTWRSFREPDGFTYVFFSDRCPPGCFEQTTDGLPLPPDDQNLDTGAAKLYIEKLLRSYRVTLKP